MTEAQLVIQNIGGVVVVNFGGASILDAQTIETIGRQLYELVDKQAQRKIVLDFSQVKSLSSSLLGVLVSLRNKAKAIKGQVAITGLRPELRKPFKITRMDKFFRFFEDEDSALNSFGVKTA